MIWPFHRKKKPVHVGPTSVDWKPGDMAECVHDNWKYPSAVAPIVGDQALVTKVGLFTQPDGDTFIGLRLLRFQGCYATTAFRKIILTDTGADRKVSKTNPIKQVEDA